jgi:hypothetical protein
LSLKPIPVHRFLMRPYEKIWKKSYAKLNLIFIK